MTGPDLIAEPGDKLYEDGPLALCKTLQAEVERRDRMIDWLISLCIKSGDCPDYILGGCPDDDCDGAMDAGRAAQCWRKEAEKAVSDAQEV